MTKDLSRVSFLLSEFVWSQKCDEIMEVKWNNWYEIIQWYSDMVYMMRHVALKESSISKP